VWRILRCFLRWWIIVPLLLLVSYLVALNQTGNQLAAELAKVEASGGALRLADLAPRVPPGEANAADVYLRAFDLLTIDWETLDRMGEDADLARQVLAIQEPALRLLEQASQIRSCAFPVDWDAGFLAAFPHFTPMRDSGRLLAARAEAQAADGEMDAALSSCAAVLRMAEHAEREPVLIGALVGFALNGIGVRALEESLSQDDPSPAACRALFEQLATMDPHAALERAFQGERAKHVEVFERMRAGEVRDLLTGFDGGYLHWSQPLLLDLYRARADAEGVSPAQAFRATVYVVPPLKLARHEAHQVATFRQAGLRVRIGGGMLTMGATAPVTLAGAVTLNLAEQLALRLVDWALFGERRLHLSCSVAPMDMRTTIRPFGRPEMAIANLMTAQLARHYGASFSGHAALTDAKLPSVEAGAQKATSGVATLLAGGSLWVDAGLLSIDEVCSPVQMILDHEWMRALRHLVQPFEVSEGTLGLETILQAGPGGQYLDKTHTVRHFRWELWNPEIWSRQMLRSWASEGGRIDADQARDRALRVQEQVAKGQIEPPGMSETLERDVLRVIERARRTLAG